MISSLPNDLDAEVRKAFPDLSVATPGYALRIFSATSLYYERWAGFANVEHRIPISPDSVFPLSSVTKPFTATAILMAVERGALALDEPVSVLVEELPSAYKSVRVEQLLAQTSGIPDPYEAFERGGRGMRDLTNADIMTFLRRQRIFAFPPGERFAYSNANYVLLAEILERVEGASYAQVMQGRIFAPLGMAHSLVYDDRYVIPNRAYGYARRQKCWRTQSIDWLSYGDGGMHTTLDDGTRWGQAILTYALLTAAVQDAAWTVPQGMAVGEIGYGYGWAISRTPHGRMVYHTGGDPGFGSLMSLLPGRNLGILVLSNADGSWRSMRTLVASLYDRICR